MILNWAAASLGLTAIGVVGQKGGKGDLTLPRHVVILQLTFRVRLLWSFVCLRKLSWELHIHAISFMMLCRQEIACICNPHEQMRGVANVHGWCVSE